MSLMVTILVLFMATKMSIWTERGVSSDYVMRGKLLIQWGGGWRHVHA